MFYYKLVCCASIMCIVAVAIGQAKGLQKRFFITANSCFTQNCWECQCSHLEKHKDRIYGDDNDVCKGQCNGHTCTNIKYGDLCAIWNHGISQWNNWENWSSCSKSCGGGTMSRTRTCPVHVYPSTCIGGSDQETNHCNTKSCSVDGGWSPWQNISNCSATCDTGFIMQARFCDNPAPSNGGQLCQGDQWNKIPCLLSPCPIDGGWSSWKDSSTCSHTCGSGTMIQTRTCDSPYPANGGHDCAGSRSKFVSCNTQPCPVDGSWSSWKNSSTCSNTCGGGIMMQTRTCDSPNPANGGQNCTGSQSKFISCNNQPCPAKGLQKRFFITVNSCFTQHCWECQCSHLGKDKDRRDGDDNDVCNGHCNGHTCKHIKYGDFCALWNHGISQWNNWENWSSCSKSCGGGTMSRTRTCPVHVYPSTCIGGSDQETNHCNTKSCLVDGGWSPWQNISNCSATCGTGFIMQVRFCDNPAPSNGGQLCQGDQWNKIPCLLSPCPIDGGWSSWKDSSTCSHTCGSGTMIQTRTCDSPYPANGGHDCAGSRSKFVSCNTQPCPVDGSWSSWKNSSTCSNTCGGGIMMQTRTCDSPNPANGGQNCTGSQSKFISCNNQPCPVNTAVNINQFSNVTNGGPSPSASQQVAPTANLTTVSTLTNGGGTSQNQQVSSTTIQTILSSHAGRTSLGPSQQIQTTVKQSMLSNFTNGGTSQSTSLTVPLPTKQNKTGGLGLTTGITNTAGITQIAIGPTVSATKISASPITSNTTTWNTVTSDNTTLPSSTTLLMSKTQNQSTQGSTTHNNSPTSCVLCSGPSYICEQRYHKEQCPDVSHQYCINKMTNNRDGTRLLERRCATKNECEIDWWQNTSDRDECTKYDVTQAVFRIFKCTYCCSGPFCNEHLIPKNLYLGHH